MLLNNYQSNFVVFLKRNIPVKKTAELKESAALSFVHSNPLIRWFFWQRIIKAQRMVKSFKPTRILDFGCGSGVLLPFSCRLAKKVYALDLNHYFTNKVKKRFNLNNLEIINYDQGRIPLKNDTIDLIFSLEVFEHINNLDETIDELYRICRPGGYLLFSLPTENCWYKLGRKLAGFTGEYHRQTYLKVKEKVSRKFNFIKDDKLYKFFPLYVFYLVKKDK